MDLLTLREASAETGLSVQALRRRAERGTLRVIRSPRDGLRRVPRDDLAKAGLLPGSDPKPGSEIVLRGVVERLRRELDAAQRRAQAESEARERVELEVFEAHAHRQASDARLAEIAAAGPIKAWRLRRALRS